jgi:hypothetical protein
MKRDTFHGESDQRAGKLALVREALSAAVEQESLREVARKVGMSPTGLRGMITGADPYAKTWDKALAWYARRITARRADRAPHALDAETVAGLFDLLLRDLPERHRAGARARALLAFSTVFAACGVAPPAWLAEFGADASRPGR